MIRTVALVVLALLVVGCSQNQQQAQGPFGAPIPPPYGSATPTNSANLPHPIGNQSPLGITAPDSTPAPPSTEPPLVPPKSTAPIIRGGGTPDADVSAAFPPFRRRTEPRPDALPSPFAPKDAPPVAKAPPKAGAPEGPSPAAKNLGELKALLTSVNAVWKTVDTYEAMLTRREVNPKGDPNKELVFYQYRREPMAVFMRNVGESGKGREVIYNPSKHGDKMYVMLGEGDNRLMKAGFIAPAISPEDPRVKEKARYSIRDAGYYRGVITLNAAVAKVEAGRLPADAVVFDGEVQRPEYPYPLVSVTHKLRASDEPLLPNGGTRVHFFDMKKESPSYGMLVLTITTDPAGKEAEYYLFEKVKSPAGLTDADFDPARLGKKK